TGRPFDDIKPIIDGFEWLSDADKKMIYTDNAVKVFNL
ncbi:MAG: amidohydrolase, partial [Kordiimonadaceae bacterium]|nr:amidohydrolase [Kordiimonadaceae bacterium]